jgi:hypothetical protein
MAINPEEFGASFQGFIEQMTAQKKPADAPFFVQKLREHFGSEPSKLPIVSESFAKHDHVLRRAALYAADQEGEIVVSDRYLDEALHDLLVQGGDLTKSLLGFQSRLGFGDYTRNH